ncbi:hypothetical protein BDP27DRAFT_1423769 [Rhodocollybia butyracea]|uniref:Uncharacterized protein n=1 Tax=Rhodocollybia butyracea TaxID=206335 RepID=A0A9P5PQ47_9AGAR|nr:hypothetical protein BDP27DRAFT_1423769 [Rhodocollybia butyracea]
MPPLQFLLTLLLVSASFLATIASPLMILVNLGHNDLGIVENRETLVSKAQPIEVPVALWTAHEGETNEHWSLIIDSKNGFHAIMFLTDQASMVVRTFTYDVAKESALKKLCMAKFKTKEEMDDVFSQLAKIPMTLKPTEKGGNCMDYIQKALDMLQEKGHIDKVPADIDRLLQGSYERGRRSVRHTLAEAGARD